MKLFFIWLFFIVYFTQLVVLVLGCVYETITKKYTIICLAIPFGCFAWVVKYYKELED